MKQEQFTDIFNATVAKCEQLLIIKGKEYATADRLHNFKVAADLQKETSIQALGGMLAKHVVSVFDMITDSSEFSLEQWDEKIIDAMNYLFLLRACVIEELNL